MERDGLCAVLALIRHGTSLAKIHTRGLRRPAHRRSGSAGTGRATLGASAAPAYHRAPMKRPYRVVVAKPGLDGHDRGAKVIARALRDEGFEVVYTGLHQTPEQVVSAVVQEDADALGLSLLSGAHLTLVPKIVDALAEAGRADVLLIVGGTIPDADIPTLKAAGVWEVFTPGAPLPLIGSQLADALDEREERLAG
jgi:methylmalonyl-CoA mutase, C-terminal domain